MGRGQERRSEIGLEIFAGYDSRLPPPSPVEINQLAIELPSHGDPADIALPIYERWMRRWRSLQSRRAKEGSEKSALSTKAREARWRAMYGFSDISGVTRSTTFESLCARVLQEKIATTGNLTHGHIYNLFSTCVHRADLCGKGDACAIWADSTSCNYDAAPLSQRTWTPKRREIWGDAVRANVTTINDAVDNLYYSCADAFATVSDYECLADCLMTAFVRDYEDEDGYGVHQLNTSLMRTASTTVFDTRRLQMGVTEICSYAYYESLLRSTSKTLGLDPHGATCVVADTIAPGQSGSYMTVRTLTCGIAPTIGYMEGLARLSGRDAVPFAYGSFVAYVNDVTDIATDVETNDTNTAAETAARLRTTAAAAYNCVRSMCMRQDDYGVVCCCSSIYHAITIRSCNTWVENRPERRKHNAVIQAQNNADSRRILQWLISAQEDGGRRINGLKNMIDWVTSVVSKGKIDQDQISHSDTAELERAICEWYFALIQCYSPRALGRSVAEHAAAAGAFKRAELTIRGLIWEREDRDLLLYGLRWVGTNDGEVARGEVWWCEPQIVPASRISAYIRRPTHNAYQQ